MLLLFLFGALIIYMWLEGRGNKIVYTNLHFSTLPQQFSGLRIFFISDIHRRKVNGKILQQIKNNIDLIIIGGDLAEKGVPFTNIQKNVKALMKVAPTYFVWGNNDYELNHLQLEKMLVAEGVSVLSNTSVSFTRQKAVVHLIGVDDFGHQRVDLKKALSNCTNGFKILVSHNPSISRMLNETHDIKLLLSGHTHGGQIRLFGLGITEKAGLKSIGDDSYMLISNGYGTTRLPFRLGAPAQTHVITLLAK